jgi:hypothetical protein
MGVCLLRRPMRRRPAQPGSGPDDPSSRTIGGKVIYGRYRGQRAGTGRCGSVRDGVAAVLGCRAVGGQGKLRRLAAVCVCGTTRSDSCTGRCRSSRSSRMLVDMDVPLVAIVAGIVCLVGILLGLVNEWLAKLVSPRLSKRTMLTCWAALAAVVVLGTAGMSYLTATPDGAGSSRVDAIPDASVSTSGPGSRSLASWITEVNSTCEPFSSRLAGLKPSAGASVQEYISAFKKAIDVYKVLLGDLNRIDLPSDGAGRARAGDWISAYNSWYEALLTVTQALDDAAGPGTTALDQVLGLPAVKSAQSKFEDAVATAKSKGDALGVECPGMKT